MYTRPIQLFKLSETKLKFIIVFLCSTLFIENSHSQWLNDYCYRKAITINASQVSGPGAHADFPVMISISNDNDLRSRANSGIVESDLGNDIRFTDNGGINLLDFEIEDYDEVNGDLVAWVRIPTLSATTNTVIYIYFGNPSFTAYPYPEDTWNSNYLGVWHTNADVNDATSHGNDGTNFGSTAASGVAGGGLALDGSADYFQLPDIDAVEGTFSFWMNLDNNFNAASATSQSLVSKYTSVDNHFNFILCGLDNATYADYGQIYFNIEYGGLSPRQKTTTNSWNAGTWYYVTGRWGDTHSISVNGTLEDTENITRQLQENVPIEVGRGFIEQLGAIRYFDGIFDEIRISDISRSDSWLSTEHNNLSNPTEFRSIGSLEDNPPSPNAGTDADVCDILSHTLMATDNTVSSRQWSYVSGPNPSPVFSDPTSPFSSVSVGLFGTYVFRWTETNGSCSSFDDVVIHFQESPMGLATSPNQMVCSDDFVHDIILSTSNGMDAGTTYAWTRDKAGIVFGIPTSGTGNISGPLHNLTPEVQIVTFRITPTSAAGCQGADFDVIIEVLPEIRVDYTEYQVVCSFENTNPIQFSSFVTSGTMEYTWVNTDPSIGLAANGSGNIPAFPAINFGMAPVVAYITVLPELTYNGFTCMGQPEVFTITVNPEAQVHPLPNQEVCNNDFVWNEPFFTDNVVGITSYSWFNYNPTIGLPASGADNIPPFVAFNFGPVPEHAAIDVHPHFEYDGHICEGPVQQFTITVNPTAQVNQPADLVVDPGENIPGVIFTTVNTMGTTSYNWTNDDPTIGLTASGTGDIPPFMAVNSSESPRMATITVRPEFTVFGATCLGPDQEFTITVNPSDPEAFAGVDQDICGTLATNLEGNNPAIGTGTWSQVSGPGTVVFGDENVYNTSATTSIYGTYVLRWTIELGGQTSSDEVAISFRENPVDASAGPDQNLCEVLATTLDAIAHAYQAGSDHSGSTALWEYVSGPGAAPVFSNMFSPTSDVVVPQYGTYILRWTETNGLCYVSQDVHIDFLEGPIGQSTPDNQLVCSNTIISSIEFSTINGMDAGTTYSWTRDNTENVTGLPNTGTGNISGTPINLTGVEQIVTYTIIPTDANGCDGNAFTATVTVYPEPIGSPSQTIQWVCSETAITDIVLSTWNGMDAYTTYTWTRDNNASVSGLPNSGTSTISGTPSNHTDAVQWVTYTITPTSIHGCQGDDTTTLISVNPIPNMQVAVDSLVCSDSDVMFTIANLNSDVYGDWNYDLSVDYGKSINGLNIGGAYVASDLILVDHLVNNDNVAHRVAYRFTPRIDPIGGGSDCVNGLDTTIYVWVNPVPTIEVIFTDTLLCNGETTTLTITNPNNPIRGIWMYDLLVTVDPEISGSISNQTSISTSTIIETLTNSDTIVHKAVYQFVPRITPDDGEVDCNNGRDTSIVIWVNPTAQVNDPSDQVVDNNGNTTPIVFYSNTHGGVVTYSWINDTPSIGLASNGIGDIASFAAINTGTLPVVATITVTPEFSNFGIACTGPSEQFSITVNPAAPDAEAGPDQDNCGTLVTSLEGNDPIGGTGTWTQVNGPGTISFGDIHSFNISATATTYGTYILRWTITSSVEPSNDEVTIIFMEDPLGSSAGADQQLCGLLTTSLEGIAHTYQSGSEHNGSTMQWDYVSGPDINPVFSDISSPTSEITVTLHGTYVFQWTETNGTCSRVDEVIVEVKPVPQTPTITFNSDSLLSDSELGNQWYVDGTLIADALGSFYIPNATGNYYTIVSEDGCNSEKSKNIYVQISDVVQNEFSEINIYPNPTDDFIKIETGDIGRYILEVTASTGQRMLQEVVTDPIYSVDLSSFINGIYFITIKAKDYLTTEKIIKF